MTDKIKSIFINAADVKDLKILGNDVSGPLLTAESLERAEISVNIEIPTTPTPSFNPWYKKPAGLIFIGIVSSVIATVIVSALNIT